MKYLIFDAGPVISLSMSGLLPVLRSLKKEFDGEFIITPAVKEELVDKPMKIKKFKLEAIRVKKLLDEGVFRMSSEIVDDSKLERETDRILRLFDGAVSFSNGREKIKIVHKGEVSCLAFANLSNCHNLLVVDERAVRLIFEDSKGLKKMMEKRLHASLTLYSKQIERIGDYSFVRSADLAFLAYDKGLIDLGSGVEVVDSIMYSLKSNGAVVSSGEIEQMKKILSG